MSLRIGVVGTGMMGRFHVERLASSVPDAQVVAVSDVFVEGAEQVAHAAARLATLGSSAAEKRLRARALDILALKPGEHVIEVEPGPDQAVVRDAGQFRPIQLQPDPTADHPEALVLQPSRLLGGVDAHPDQLAGGARCEAVTTDFLPRKGRLLKEQHAQAVTGHVIGGRGAAGTSADDDDVGLVGDVQRSTSVSRCLARETVHKLLQDGV